MSAPLRRPRLAALAAALLLPGFAAAAPAPADKPKDVDLVLCLDVSNSMDGLIDSAKLKLWDVVNELARLKPTPNLRVALYSYGHTGYPADAGWVRKEIDLTTDLDDVYAKLNGLKTNGGEEYVARVTRTALADQKWATSANALKVIFVCGNEAVDQDKSVSLTDVADQARKAGVIVNTIYCGSASSGEATGYREFAAKCGGSGAAIDQSRARQDAAVATPFDKPLLDLSGKLNQTYLAYGAAGEKKAEQQRQQDTAATAAAPAAGVARAAAKANALYKNDAWDLIDRAKNDKAFDLKKLTEAELPEEMKKLKPEEREGYLKKKADERAAVQKEINDLSAKRAAFVAEEMKKQPRPAGEVALDEALKQMIRAQAEAKGFEVEKK